MELDTLQEDKPDGFGKYVIVRTYSAGVHSGYLQRQSGKEVVLTNARRLWRWFSRLSLSDLAAEGTPKPENCKFSVPAPRIVLTDAIEIISVTPEAQASLESVPCQN